MMNMRVRGGDEAFEKRVRFIGLALKFGMKLARDEEGVVLQFDHFHEFAIG